MKTETAQEMFDFLAQVIRDGNGDAILLFDTEARTFEYHMAEIGCSYYEEQGEAMDYKFISIHEKRL